VLVRTSLARYGLVVTAVVGIYVVWAVAVVVPGDPLRLANVGQRFLDQGRGASPTIDRLESTSPEGYDGQFVAYIALDPEDAAAYLDWPRYRYARIVYPLLARALSLGDPAVLGWALLVLNIAAAGLLTLCVAVWLRRNGASAWYAAIAGLAPGFAIGIVRDLTEPLAYALVALGMVLVTRARRDRDLVLATGAFALAAFTRETTLLFAFAVALTLLIGASDMPAFRVRRPAAAVWLIAGSCGPVILWRLVLPSLVGGPPPVSALSPIPFAGLIERRPYDDEETLQLVAILVPSALAIALVGLLIRQLTPATIALALNFVVLVVFLGEPGWSEFVSSGRISYGVVLAFVLCLPAIQPSGRRLLVSVMPACAWAFGWVVVLPRMLEP
jgi:hypothetical protein